PVEEEGGDAALIDTTKAPAPGAPSPAAAVAQMLGVAAKAPEAAGTLSNLAEAVGAKTKAVPQGPLPGQAQATMDRLKGEYEGFLAGTPGEAPLPPTIDTNPLARKGPAKHVERFGIEAPKSDMQILQERRALEDMLKVRGPEVTPEEIASAPSVLNERGI